jgi:hypothetical protein
LKKGETEPVMFDGFVKSDYLPDLLRRKQAGMCYSDERSEEESL